MKLIISKDSLPKSSFLSVFLRMRIMFESRLALFSLPEACLRIAHRGTHIPQNAIFKHASIFLLDICRFLFYYSPNNVKALKRKVDGGICHRELLSVRLSTEYTVENGLGAAHRLFPTEYRLRWERPLQRQSIEGLTAFPYLQRSAPRGPGELRW